MSEEPTYEEGEAPQKRQILEKPVPDESQTSTEPNGENKVSRDHPHGPPLREEDPKKLKWPRKDSKGGSNRDKSKEENKT